MSDILNSIELDTGLVFKVKFINGKIENDLACFIAINKASIVAIVDCLSLFGENRATFTRFDQIEIAGVIVPLCHELSQNLKNIRSEREDYNIKVISSCYSGIFEHISDIKYFKTSTQKILFNKFGFRSKNSISGLNNSQKSLPKNVW